MDLWIRSQDKFKIVKVENFQVNFECIICLDKVEGIITLGEYKTKERALEVLDEIQSLLIPKLILNSYDNITPEFSENITITPISTDIKQFNSYVYEMPEE